MICLLVGLPHAQCASAQDATTAIASANQALQAAFENVLNIEKSGVNVSALIDQLNSAGINLTLANTDLSNRSYSEAVNQADACQALANNVAADAATMKNQNPSWLSSFLPTLITGFVGSGLFIVSLVLTWFWFRRHYVRKLSKSRPKVVATCGD
jgi:4-amino-4-deoxy-L-arabinose transferase-like glycosyltransferase